jgi:hypothetical protein
MADKKVTGTVKWFNVKKGCTCPPPLALFSAVVDADMCALTCLHAPSPANILCGPACVLPGFSAPSGFSASQRTRTPMLPPTQLQPRHPDLPTHIPPMNPLQTVSSPPRTAETTFLSTRLLFMLRCARLFPVSDFALVAHTHTHTHTHPTYCNDDVGACGCMCVCGAWVFIYVCAYAHRVSARSRRRSPSSLISPTTEASPRQST